MKAEPAVLRLCVQSCNKEMKAILLVLWYIFESVHVDDIIINLSISAVTYNSMLLCRSVGTSLFCQLGTKESKKVKLNGREQIYIQLGILVNCTNIQTFKNFRNCKHSQF